MSAFDLRDFNTLSKRHNYFMTNNRIEGFPNLAENSLILRKILECRNSSSSDKRFENKIKPKKLFGSQNQKIYHIVKYIDIQYYLRKNKIIQIGQIDLEDQ